MKVASRQGLSYLQSSVLSWRRRIRHRVATTIDVSDDLTSARFGCRSAIEERRAVSLFYKEQGTVKWLRDNVKPGQVFIDIGANVGIYTVLAAQLTGSEGKVYAFEPHAVNFSSLMENIAINQLERICVPISIALTKEPGYLPFHYASLTAGSSMSQLGQSVDPDGRDISKGVAELKAATSLDCLIAADLIASPQHIKIDVDGVEADIVEGMRNVLCGETPPLTVQVEIQPDTRLAVIAQMQEYGFQIDHIHHTQSGKERIASGVSSDDVTHNIVFKRKHS